MNRTFCRLMLTAAVVLGLVRLADLCAFTDADGRKPFQLPHPDLHRFPVCFDQTRIEQ